ncbi:MAG: hypothetical protein ACREKF_13635 [Candidatus Methylomirabilales bacterium]
MAREGSGRGLAWLALLTALLALGLAFLAYRQAGGAAALQARVDVLQKAVETARSETADALKKVEDALRPGQGRPAKR